MNIKELIYELENKHNSPEEVYLVDNEYQNFELYRNMI